MHGQSTGFMIGSYQNQRAVVFLGKIEPCAHSVIKVDQFRNKVLLVMIMSGRVDLGAFHHQHKSITIF
jgi:hypothetical protein